MPAVQPAAGAQLAAFAQGKAVGSTTMESPLPWCAGQFDPAQIGALARAGDPVFLAAYWLGEMLAEVRAPPPALFNSDGDPLEPMRVCFAFAPAQRAAVQDRLAGAGEYQQEDGDGDEWTWMRSAASGLADPNTGPSTHDLIVDSFDASGTVWGWIELESVRLVSRLNSRRRAEAAVEDLSRRLAGVAAFSSLEADEELPSDRPGGGGR